MAVLQGWGGVAVVLTFFVFPPHTTTTRHPSLHLKNRMKPIECRRAFQHPYVFFPRSSWWAQSSAFRGSFAASSRAPSFCFFSPPRPPPRSEFLAEEGSWGFFSSLHCSFKGEFCKARIRFFFFNTVHFEVYQNLHNSPRLVKSSPLKKKKKKTKAVSSVLQLSWIEETLLCCKKKKRSSQNLWNRIRKWCEWAVLPPFILLFMQAGKRNVIMCHNKTEVKRILALFCFLRIWIEEEEGKQIKCFFSFSCFFVNLIVAPSSLSCLFSLSVVFLCFFETSSFSFNVCFSSDRLILLIS